MRCVRPAELVSAALSARAEGPSSSSGISITVELDDTELVGLVMPAGSAGECSGVICPEPAVLPASISKALNARSVEREREQPRKT